MTWEFVIYSGSKRQKIEDPMNNRKWKTKQKIKKN